MKSNRPLGLAALLAVTGFVAAIGVFAVDGSRSKQAVLTQVAKSTPGAGSATPSAVPRARAPAPSSARDVTQPENPQSDERWRRKIASSDARERADAVDEIPSAAPANGEEVLTRILETDADRYVRERAIFAYSELAGLRAVPLLKKVALEGGDELLGAAARANLERIHEDHPEPSRGSLNVVLPPSIAVGKPFDVSMELESTVDVPKAQLEMALPPGIEVVSPSVTRLDGRLEAGEVKPFVVRLRVTKEPLDARIRLRVKLDYRGELDVEVLHRTLQVSAKGGTGTVFLAKVPD